MPTHPSSTRLRAVAAWGCVIAIQVALLSVLLRPGETSEGARLRLTTPAFGPDSRLELLFDRDMTPPEQVGRVALESPLRIDPRLAGEFVWLSPRHGVFMQSESPRMDTAYTFRLATGLREAGGKQSDARLHRTLRTPAFDVATVRANYRSLHNNSSLPVVHVAFNDLVSPTEIAHYCEFRNRDQVVPAKVTGHSPLTLPGHPVEGSPGGKDARVPDAWSRADESDSSVNAARVEPATRLPAGADWRLVLRAGLPAQRGGQRMAQERVVRIGHVPGMDVVNISAFNAYDGSRHIAARLTAHPAGAGEHSISIQPRPSHLTVHAGYRSLRLGGDFELGREYRVTIHAGLTNHHGDRLSTDVLRVVRFAPLPARVVLPGRDEILYAGGRGQLEFLAFNTPAVRLRAKRVRGDALIHTLRGYQSRSRNEESERDYPFDLVPGETVADRHFDTRSAVDQAFRSGIDLPSLIGGLGPVFVDLQPTGEGGRVGAQSLVQVTDLGLLWKRHTEGWRAQVFSLRDASPVARARVALRDENGDPLAETRCDREGRADLPHQERARWIEVATPDDRLALPLHEGGLYASGVPTTWRLPQANEAKLFLFTDRPVYEPGDEVRLKGIVRQIDDLLTLPPAGTPVAVTLFDSRGSAIARTNLALSAAGAFDWRFAAPDRRHGRHRLTVASQGAEESITFLVQNYEPDAFEVKLSSAKEVAAGEDAAFAVTGRYLFGSALSEAEARWAMEAMGERFKSAALPTFVFGEHVNIRQLSRDFERRHAKGEGRLQGGEALRVAIPSYAGLHPQRLAFEVEVTDLNQQTIHQRRELVAHASEFYLGIEPPPKRPREKESPVIRLAAAPSSGEPLERPIDVSLRLDLVRRRNYRVVGTGGSIDYRSEPRLVEVESRRVTLTGITEFRLPTLPEPGEYLVTVSTKDAAGRPVESRLTFSAAGADAVVWDYRNAAELTIKTDRADYQPGDTADLLLEAPFAGTAYVTVERERAHYSFTTNVTAGAPVIRVPLRREDAPNVFASVTLIRGGRDSGRLHPAPEFRHGYAQLRVTPPGTRLDLELTADREEYRPGETVTITCGVRSHRGRPVRDAEVTLYAVDEGLLRLTGGEAPDPHDHFHAPRPLAVRSHLSLSELLPEDPADLRFHNKGYVIGGGGRAAGVRRHFSAGPLWQPALRTDRRGRVTATFTAPDNLTRYRVVAVVHHGGERFGKAEANITVNKPLQIEPSLPAFARVGDRVEARALVVNRTRREGEVRVTRAPGDESRLLRLAAGEAGTVAFPTIFTGAGETNWIWTTRFTDPLRSAEGDEVSRGLRVEDAMPRRREVLVGPVTGATNLLAAADPALLASPAAQAELMLSSSPLLEAQGGVDHLLRYPYGCVEQTSSSLLPWLLIARAPGLADAIGTTRAEIRIAVDAGVRRLFSMQTSDGGLSYWPGGDRSMFWGGAWAAFVLSHHDMSPHGKEWTALLDHLRDRLHEAPMNNPNGLDQSHALALAALARAGRPLPELHRRFHERRASLDASTRALIAWAESHSTRREAWSRDLLTVENSPTNNAYFGSRHRRLAIESLAWRATDPARADALLRTLMDGRRNGQWATTQDNAWALLAAVERGPAESSRIEGTLLDQPVSLEAGRLIRQLVDPRKHRELPLRTAGTAYARLEVSAPIPPDAAPVADRGFRLTREYQRLNNPDGPEEWRVGDSILVTLTLESKSDAEYVAIDDPQPALLEAINPEFKSRASTEGSADNGWFSSHRELRRDRALFFQDHLPAGKYVIRYLARVRAAGRAIAPPAKVERMYAPDRLGTTRAQMVEARP